MKRNALTILVGAVLLAIFVVLLFTFQVRYTEQVVVTTFDNPTRFIEKPGLYWKWPAPIQKVYRFDKRIQTFEDDPQEETYTFDKQPLLVRVFAGWKITNPTNFFSRFPSGEVSEATPVLQGLIRTAKNAVVGKHPFSNFVSTNPQELKFVQIEREMTELVQTNAEQNYGIHVQFIGIDKLALPEGVTAKVFDRMKAEREKVVASLKAQGDMDATNILSTAEAARQEMLARATAQAIGIRGNADAEARKSYQIFQQNPDLANFLQKLNALKEILKDRSTLILDEQTPPFDLLRVAPAAPASAPALADKKESAAPQIAEQKK